jgi:primary-amine oxidase
VDLIFDMRISEFFIPYHPGSPRFYDLSDFNFRLTALTTTDCPFTLLSPNVCKEVHDRGLMWKDGTTGASYRGQELVLWGIIGAANYLYLEEYIFRDDGAILGRYLATGKNLPGSETVAHSHNVFWRIDIDLDGSANNAAAHLQHIEPFNPPPPTMATDTATPILTEQGFPWNPQAHDAMEISNSIFKNAHGHLSTYHLIAQPTGGIVHNTEAFTQNEFWVTPFDPGQFAARNLADTYIPQGRGVANTDIVAWVHSSLHHHPRDEDGIFSNGSFIGVTDTMSTGFMLMPNDVFDCSPLYHATCP